MLPQATPFSALSPTDITADAAMVARQGGDLQRAWQIYEALHAQEPGNAEWLHQSSLICFQFRRYEWAAERMEKALALVPNHPYLLGNLGECYLKLSRFDRATQIFTLLNKVQPDDAKVATQLAQLLLMQGRQTEAIAPLQSALRHYPEVPMLHELLATAYQKTVNSGTVYPRGMMFLKSYHARLARHYSGQTTQFTTPPTTHTFFVDRQRALKIAQQHAKIICYYIGAPLADTPHNLIAIPETLPEAREFFFATHYPYPEELEFDPAEAEERQLAELLVTVLNQAHHLRLIKALEWVDICANSKPEFKPGEPLRVFLPATRHRPGFCLQARAYAKAFRHAGCEVLLFEEGVLPGTDLPEVLGYASWLEAMAAFKPHLVVDSNAYFDWHSGQLFKVHPDVFKAMDFFDPMPMVTSGNPFPWRERDLIYALSTYIPFLQKTGAKEVMRKGLYYSSEIFNNWHKPRKRKIVFVGNGYGNVDKSVHGSQTIFAQLWDIFLSGVPITQALLDQLVEQSKFSLVMIRDHFLGHIVRNGSLRWLCEMADEIDIEIYGTDWAHQPCVQPFYKWPALPEQVAEIYNESEYVLVINPQYLDSGRLLEAVACGAIPVVYDCRPLADPPHWDEHCLWFRTKEQLRDCFSGKRPPLSPHLICEGRSYNDYAQRVVDDLYARLKQR
ncbi:MAG: tetratricopeptide repeat protein [Magnetococcales bacterium]|nr:tetratricopeptide repeat protein [Magnetococcales bacterium]